MQFSEPLKHRSNYFMSSFAHYALSIFAISQPKRKAPQVYQTHAIIIFRITRKTADIAIGVAAVKQECRSLPHRLHPSSPLVAVGGDLFQQLDQHHFPASLPASSADHLAPQPLYSAATIVLEHLARSGRSAMVPAVVYRAHFLDPSQRLVGHARLLRGPSKISLASLGSEVLVFWRWLT